MCGRVFQTYNMNQLLRIAGTTLIQNSDKHTASYNLSPGEYLPVIKHTKAPEENNRVLDMMKWGYQPYQTLLFNARAENPEQKRLFSPLINSRRCAIIVEGYYEWNAERVPFVFRPKKKLSQNAEEDKPLHIFLAGLYAHDGTFVILTRGSIGDAKRAHNRMPVILSDEEIDKWLDCEKYKYEDIKGDILDDNNEKWTSSTFSYQLDPLVNNATNNTAEVLKKADDYDAKAEGSTIKKFFASGKKSQSSQDLGKFERERRGDETDDEEEGYEEKKEEEEEPQKKKVVTVVKKSEKATPVKMSEGDEKKIHVELPKSSKKSPSQAKDLDEGKKSKEIENLLKEIKKSVEESGLNLGSEYRVKETIIVVEKADKENIEEESQKTSKDKSSAKKRKDFEGKEKDNEFTTERKKQKQTPPAQPFGVRNQFV